MHIFLKALLFFLFLVWHTQTIPKMLIDSEIGEIKKHKFQSEANQVLVGQCEGLPFSGLPYIEKLKEMQLDQKRKAI